MLLSIHLSPDEGALLKAASHREVLSLLMGPQLEGARLARIIVAARCTTPQGMA